MANEGEYDYIRGIPLKEAHEMRKDKAIIELQEQVRKLTLELEQIKGSVPFERGGHCHWELDVSSIDITYLFSYKEFDIEVLEEEEVQ